MRHEVIASFRRTFQRSRLRRGGDAGAARRRGRRPRPTVRHPLQRARHAAVPADRPRAAPQAADRRRHGPGVRDRPGVPQRGPVEPAQHRVHDDGVVRGVRRRHRRDGPHRGARRPRRQRRARHDASSRSAASTVDLAAGMAEAADGRPRRRAAIGDGGAPVAAGRASCAPSPSGHGVRWEPQWGSGKLVEELFEATVEPDIVAPVFVTGHPVEISPLARVDRTDPFLTERFELFVDSRELANGYSELNDPVEQRLRFEDEQAGQGRRRRRARLDRRGLPARPRVRHAADRRSRRRHRPAGDDAGRRRVDPRRDPLPDASPERPDPLQQVLSD